MPAETRRVVVLSSETFERICASKPATVETKAESAQTDDIVREKEEPKTLAEVQVDQKEREPDTDRLSENCAVSEPTEELEEEHPFDPLQGFPARYLKTAQTALGQLCAIQELSWDCQTGFLSISDQRLSLTLSQLLRAICVPFTKIRLPLVCSQLHTRHHIKPRNHLCLPVPEPKWHVYFKF